LIGWKNEKDQQQLNLPRRPNAAHAEAWPRAANRPSRRPKAGTRARRRPVRGEARARRRFCEQAPKLTQNTTKVGPYSSLSPTYSLIPSSSPNSRMHAPKAGRTAARGGHRH
jgi:hypothetical protein